LDPAKVSNSYLLFRNPSAPQAKRNGIRPLTFFLYLVFKEPPLFFRARISILRSAVPGRQGPNDLREEAQSISRRFTGRQTATAFSQGSRQANPASWTAGTLVRSGKSCAL
jgi:hypothetical protein